MTNFPSRLRHHLSYANLMASVAVFLALGGVGYAAATINGNNIKKQTIGAGKLKNGTLTATQVKQDALTGGVIDESTLATVPSAQSATSAANAEKAKSAETANHALTADSATTAASATTATSANTAASANDAETLDGFSAQQLQVTCPADTDLFGGMCWDEDPRPVAGWIAASIDCADDGGRLPTLSELIAYIAQPEAQVSAPNWSGDAGDVDEINGDQFALVHSESGSSLKRSPETFGYRCLFYRTN
jgi:hypothetical protein